VKPSVSRKRERVSLVAVPIKDTIKEVDDDKIVLRTLEREAVGDQTPQAFRRRYSDALMRILCA